MIWTLTRDSMVRDLLAHMLSVMWRPAIGGGKVGAVGNFQPRKRLAFGGAVKSRGGQTNGICLTSTGIADVLMPIHNQWT